MFNPSRDEARRFIEDKLVPQLPRWREQGYAERAAWRDVGAMGMLLPELPEAYGGADATLAHQLVIQEEFSRAEVPASTIVHCLVAHYHMRGPQFEANDVRQGLGYDIQMEADNNVLFDYERSGSTSPRIKCFHAETTQSVGIEPSRGEPRRGPQTRSAAQQPAVRLGG